MRFLSSAMVVAALSTPVRADDKAEKLTLQQVVTVAVRQSPDLERASLDVRAADAAVARAEGVEDTHVGAVAHLQSVNATSDPTVAGLNSTTGLTASITRLLPTGGTLGVSLDATYGHFVTSTASVHSLETSPQLTFNQPLLRGAGATGYEAPIRDARHTRDAAALEREAKGRDVLVALVEAYLQVALAQRQLDVRKGSVELASKQLASIQALLGVGKASESDEVAVQQALATRKQDVIAAEQDLLERSLALRQLAGLEIEPARLGVDTDPLPDRIETPPLDLSRTVADAYEHSAALASLAAGTKAAAAGLEGAESAAMSRLDLALTGGPAGVDARTRFSGDPPPPPPPPSLLNSVKDAASFGGYQIIANLTFDRAIERRTEKGGVAAAHARVQRAKVDERAARIAVALTASRAVRRAKAAADTIKLGEDAMRLAQQAIENEQRKFDLGRSNIFEVLRRQDDLQLARLRQASAIVDYLSARAELDGLTGQILTRFGVTMH
jgi:outer membrane protein TolC